MAGKKNIEYSKFFVELLVRIAESQLFGKGELRLSKLYSKDKVKLVGDVTFTIKLAAGMAVQFLWNITLHIGKALAYSMKEIDEGRHNMCLVDDGHKIGICEDILLLLCKW